MTLILQAGTEWGTSKVWRLSESLRDGAARGVAARLFWHWRDNES